jgi:hypothetical protein
LSVEALEDRTVPSTFLVTNTGDNGGVDPAVGAGTGTLRQAILDANYASDPAVIAFDILTTDPGYNSATGTFTIRPMAALPYIDPALANNPVVIDGTTQPGYAGTPLIELNGADAGLAASGLRCGGGHDTIQGFDINSFSGFGIFLRSNNNTVQGCYIATDVTGTQPLPNLRGGISVGDFNSVSSFGNTIGGTALGQGNVISGNGSTNYYSAPLGASPAGVILFGPNNVVEGNLIGLTADGTAAVGTNVWPGVMVFAGNNTIGGPSVIGASSPGARNVISGSVDNTGIDINYDYQPVQGVVIEGNYIGTNAAGNAAVGNGDGVYGGGSTTLIEGNLISGNTRDGLTIGGLGTIVKGNYIGTDATGMAPLGNGSTGLYAGYSDMTIVGNLISANGSSGTGTNDRDGIVLTTGSVPFTGTIVQGNRIGTDLAGNPTLGMGNAGDGVLVSHGYGENITNTLIGGTTPGAANIIAGNGGSGVDMIGSGAFDNSIEGNSIYANHGLGIDLGDEGVPATNTANDAANHFGPNELMNFPVLTSASFGATGTTVSGSLDTNTAGGLYPSGTLITLDFYANPTPGPTAYAQGQTWIGSEIVTTDGTSHLPFNATNLAPLPAGQDYVTATATGPAAVATDATGNTSEFCKSVLALTESVSVSSTGGPSTAATTPTTPGGPQLTAAGSGFDGTLTVAQYQSSPVSGFSAAGSYFDINVGSNDLGTGSSVQAVFSNLTTPGATVFWFNGNTWQPVTDASGNTITADASGTATVMLTMATSPTLAQLTGTYFFAGILPATPTTTTVSSSVSAVIYGQSVALTATVTPASGAFDNLGTVQFAVDGVPFGAPVAPSGGSATLPTAATLPTGVHYVSAAYSGDSLFSTSNSLPSGANLIATVAGTGSPYGAGNAGYNGDNLPATSAELNSPAGVAVDAAGDLFIADTANNRIREVLATTHQIITVAGTGAAGFSGDGGLATSAELNRPESVTVDAAGDLFIADTANNRIREVLATTQKISTIAGNGIQGYSGDNGLATSAELNGPSSMAVDAGGDLFIADFGNDRIREELASTHQIITVAGNGTIGFSGDNGPATSAEFADAFGVAVDAAGDLFIADSYNGRIREVLKSTGQIITIAGTGAGYHVSGSGDNGPATSAPIYFPEGVALDAAGDLFIAETREAQIREVSANTGLITTVAGNGSYGYSGDNGPATSAQMDSPQSVALDAAGDLFIADPSENVIREVPGGLALTVNPAPLTVTANPQTKIAGAADPALTYQITAGNPVGADSLTGSLTRDLAGLPTGEIPRAYTIRQGTLSAGPNYALTFVNSVLFITAASDPVQSLSTVGISSTAGSSTATTTANSGAPQLAATGSGFDGALTVAQYQGAPVSGFLAAGSYFDVNLGSTDLGANSSVQAVFSNLTPAPGATVSWWDGTTWQPVKDASGYSVTANTSGTATVTLTAATSPTLAQLTGTEFFAGTFQPTLSAATGGTVVVGTGVPLTATATLAGGANPAGSITFTLYDPSGKKVDAETAPVSGNGTYATPKGFVPTLAGTYQWVAAYTSSNGFNGNAGSTLGAAPEVAVGSGATVVGNALYLVGGATSNDQVNVQAIGTAQDGSTGFSVQGSLAGTLLNKPYSPSLGITSIYFVGFAGNDQVQLGNLTYLTVSITAANGNDQVQGDNDNGNTTVSFGSGNDNVTLGNGNNHITLGNGNNHVQLGSGMNTVTLGTATGKGNNNVQVSNGSYNVVTVYGNGNNSIQIGNGSNNQVTLPGNGNDIVTIGNGNTVKVTGNGNDNVTIGNGGDDFVTMSGSGNDNLYTGNGTAQDNFYVLGSGKYNLNRGMGWARL